jgi:hypothetical protein
MKGTASAKLRANPKSHVRLLVLLLLLQVGNAQHPRWHELCDPTSTDFAQAPLILGTDNQTVLELTGVPTGSPAVGFWWDLLQYCGTKEAEAAFPAASFHHGAGMLSGKVAAFASASLHMAHSAPQM